MQRKSLKLLPIATSMVATSLFGSIYIVPADIDNYKRKTDQSFYDIYQNQDSAIKINPNMKTFTDNISTSQRIFEGETIRTVSQGSVSGTAIPAGVTAKVKIRGIPYVLGTDSKGGVFINGAYSDGKQVRRRGKDAINKGNAPCGANSKYGCSRRQRYAEELYFDAPSSLITVASVMQSRNYSCSKYGCNPTSNWYTSALRNINKESVDLKKVLLNNATNSKIKIGNARALDNMTTTKRTSALDYTMTMKKMGWHRK